MIQEVQFYGCNFTDFSISAFKFLKNSEKGVHIL